MDVDPDNSFINTLNQIADELGNLSVGQLSFRDQCAIAAIPLIIHRNNIDAWAAKDAKDCFDFADAMEAERQKRDGK